MEEKCVVLSMSVRAGLPIGARIAYPRRVTKFVLYLCGGFFV